MRSWSFFLLIAALAAQTRTGEVTTREETPTFQSSVNLVRVPVVIRDKQGHALGSFHKEDFQLTDRGKPQEIAQFAIEASAVAQHVPVEAGHARPAESQEEIPGSPAAEASKPAVPTRFVAFVFDDVHLQMEDLVNARKAALQHLEHGIPPQERVALLTLSGSVSLEFTSDVAKFREMLMKVMPVPPRVYFPPASFYLADQFMKSPGDEQANCNLTPPCSVDCSQLMPPVLRMQTEVTIECLQLTCQRVLEAPGIARDTFRSVYNDGASEASNAFRILNNVVRLLGSMPGDRVMILVSPGIYLPDELQRSLAESIDRATRSGVIINTLDARGVYTVDPGAGEASQCGLSLPQTQVEVAKYNHFAITAQGLILDDLAHSTGGTAVRDNDLLGGFNRLANPPEYVYYLSFYPGDLKPDGKFHEIKVTLANSQGLSVQARRGYWAPSHLEDAATAATREISEAVFSHDELRDLPLDIDTQFYKTTAADARLKVIAHLDIQQLHLRKQDDRNRDDVTVVCALFDGNGNYLKGTQKVVELRVKDENIERRRDLGVTTNSDFDVKSGAYMIRVVARDAEGQQMASANDTVEIP
ncbi:MAG: VWA domain-containing protein [Bryobacteraceae bacterium]